jgi:tripartite-type tricarboxylate transporter receptor subunit TctC
VTLTRRLLLIAAALPLAAPPLAFAQQYPSTPVKVIVAASAGTSIDATRGFHRAPRETLERLDPGQ